MKMLLEGSIYHQGAWTFFLKSMTSNESDKLEVSMLTSLVNMLEDQSIYQEVK